MESQGRVEARRLIERIGRELTLDGASRGSRFETLITSCLEILSTQLYAKSTHFLLELLQNADDNVHECKTPALSFTYKPGSLRIDCNEAGLTEANVEALCAVNRSTKSAKARHGEHIGEKGIGFKSVFKVADVVWISSRNFTFKFDRVKSALGMVTPIWADFPEPAKAGCTSMYLELSSDCDQQDLVRELMEFDANLLIFLRRVQEINLRIVRPQIDHRHQGSDVWQKTICKTEDEQHGKTAVLILDGERELQYLIRSHVVRGLPPEKKRPNWSETRLLLGFPVLDPDQGNPRLLLQNVYSFLPIRNYGLKFLLQGDFLLTASREDIEGTLPWNITLRVAVAEAFLESVRHFNAGELKFVWPYYLPSASTAAGTFFEPAVQTVLGGLRERDILESCAGVMTKPCKLKSVPLEQFADQEGIPFTLGRRTQCRYLSLNYSSAVAEATTSIGVSQLSTHEFLQDLGDLVADEADAFYSKPASWHSQLAATLLRPGTDAGLLETIMDMRIIPLQDGSWTSARGQSIFFSDPESTLEVPSGIPMLLVDSAAVSDPNRRRLFTMLGIKACVASEICRLVLDVHAPTDFKPEALTTAQLVSHAMFLWKTSWNPPKGTDIWFATAQGNRCRGRELYIPGCSETHSAASRIFARLKARFPIIHNDYLAASDDGDWTNWLVQNLGLTRTPRLVTPQIMPDPEPVVILEPRTGAQIRGPTANSSQSLATEHSLPTIASALGAMDFGNHQRPGPPISKNPALPDDFNHDSFLLQDDTAMRRYFGDDNPEDVAVECSPTPGTSLGGYSNLSDEELHEDDFQFVYDHSKQHQEDVGWPVGNAEALMENKALQMVPGQQLTNFTAKDAHIEGRDTQLTILFQLSPEFVFMFRECRTSDVLEVLKDNWQHYSQWVDGTHMKWQSSDFRAASAEVQNSLVNCLVQTARGPCLLGETVLPKLDEELDQGRCIPSVVIPDPSNSNWGFLSHFGVITTVDVHLYIRCLKAIANDSNPDVDKVAYLYDKVQSLYRGKEKFISNEFRTSDIVLTKSLAGPTQPVRVPQWTNMSVCIAMGIDLKSEYPASSYLFECLRSPAGDPIAVKVAAASRITSSNTLEEISRCLCELSTAVAGVSVTKAAQLLRTLQDQRNAIFPIIRGERKRNKFDDLIDSKATGWYIADLPNLRDSFIGVLPLLALSVEDVASIQELLVALRLEDRILSNLAIKHARPKGRVAPHWPYMNLVRDRAPFLKALVSPDSGEKDTILRQIDGIRVNVATKIAVNFTLNLVGTKMEGNPVHGEATIQTSGEQLTLFLSEECAASDTPSYELVKLMAETLQVRDRYFPLLHISLSNTGAECILSTFIQHKVPVKGLSRGKTDSGHPTRRGDLMRILPPASSKASVSRPYFPRSRRSRGATAADRTEYHWSRTATHCGRQDSTQDHEDRRLPMLIPLHASRPLLPSGHLAPSSATTPMSSTLVGSDHIQHLGGHMVRNAANAHGQVITMVDDQQLSRLFEAQLGVLYNPERDWTSRSRTRSGYKPFTESGGDRWADFTLRNSLTCSALTQFLLEHGRCQTPGWQTHLQSHSSVYHVDIAVSTGSSFSHFAISSSALERMRKLRMRDGYRTRGSSMAAMDVSVLVRISDVYSDSMVSFQLLVDPWSFFGSDELTLSGGWMLQGCSKETTDGASGRRKRRKKSTPLLTPWRPSSMLASSHLQRQFGANQQPGTHNTCNNAQAYRYKPLGPASIRLLHLLPGDGIDQALQGVVVHVAHSQGAHGHSTSNEPYRALSYVWGADERTEELVTPDGVIYIAPSLSAALRHIRQRQTTLVLWVDAVCINQGDKVEKVQQIRFMPTIFQSAEFTVAFWAGTDGLECSNAAIEMLTQVDAQAQLQETEAGRDRRSDSGAPSDEDESDDMDKGSSGPTESQLVSSLWNGENIPPPDDPAWDCIVSLFSRPWFRRAWILQEAVVSADLWVVCGSSLVSWSKLHAAVEIVHCEAQVSEHETMVGVRTALEPFLALATQREWEMRQNRWALISLLEHFRQLESTLQRDRFFALLGLASDANEPEFEPDYDSPLEVIVLRFARAFVRQGRGVQLLYRAGLDGRDTDSSRRFPSWVPDWTKPRPECLHELGGGAVPFDASRSQEAKIRASSDTADLHVGGYKVGVVKNVSASSNTEAGWKEYLVEVDAMLDEASLSIVADDRDDLKWKVPIAGVEYPKLNAGGSVGLKESYKALRELLDRDANTQSQGGGPSANAASHHKRTDAGSLEKQSTSYASVLRDTAAGWRFVVTTDGHVGVAPGMVRVGDAIVVVKGGMVPFVLRRSDEREDAFRLVGECYIHGLMHGEALALDGVTETEICLY